MIYQLKSKSIGSKEVLPEEEEMVVTFKWDILSLNQIKSKPIKSIEFKSNNGSKEALPDEDMVGTFKCDIL